MERINFDEELRTFRRAEERMRVAALSAKDRLAYEVQLKFWRDYNAQMAYAKEMSEAKGRKEGKEEEKMETVFRLLSLGLTIDIVASGSGLDIETVRKLAEKKNREVGTYKL